MNGNIVLTGFMGCGKTSVGKRLSYALRRTVTDTDRWIEQKNGLTVSEIFEQYGEETFRQMETDCLEALLNEGIKNQIISTGGGLPLRKRNAELLKKLGTVVYLRVSAPVVCKRLSGDTTRPLLRGENPEEKVRTLLKKREPFYEAAADRIVDVDGKELDSILEEIVKAYGKENFFKNENTCD